MLCNSVRCTVHRVRHLHRWIAIRKHHKSGTPQKKKRPRLARRRKGEEAKRRLSHMYRAILSRRACLTKLCRNTTSEILGSHKLGAVISHNGSCKFEHRFSNLVSTIINAMNLCAYAKRRNNNVHLASFLVALEPKLPNVAQKVSQFLGHLATWIDAPRLWCQYCKKDHSLHRKLPSSLCRATMSSHRLVPIVVRVLVSWWKEE